MRFIKDHTGRLPMRPYFEALELDRECEAIIEAFLQRKYGQVSYPVPTDGLCLLIEQEAADLDMYADLSEEGDDTDGVTDFFADAKPRVKISLRLSSTARLENRLRTTLAHEYGHVRFHAPLWSAVQQTPDMFAGLSVAATIRCKRSGMFDAPDTDWMEWQAGYVSGALLMPYSRVRAIAARFLGRPIFQSVMNVHAPVALQLISEVARAFQVSREAARVRLLKLHLVSFEERMPAQVGLT